MKFLSTLCLIAVSIASLQAQTPSTPPSNETQTSIVLSNLPPVPHESASGLTQDSSKKVPAATTEQALPSSDSSFEPLFEEEEAELLSDEGIEFPNALHSVASRMGLPLPLPQARIVILKSQRRLELWSGSVLVKTYQVALGANPRGAKQKQSDSRTPEGRFKICTRNSTTSAFHVFLGLDYPSLSDAARGVRSGLITRREYQTIKARLASGQRPLWETRLGGWIGIHGGTGKAFAQKQISKRGRTDWTAGCIAVTDLEIEEIHSATKMGTPVWIRP